MKVGADNRLQKRISEAESVKFSGLAGGVRSLTAKIIRVWDHAEEALPPEFAKLIERNPGLLFGEVQVKSGARYRLIFGQSAEEIYGLFGNSASLAGMTCDVEYRGNAISSGKIKLGRAQASPVESYEETNFIASISNIVGNL